MTKQQYTTKCKCGSINFTVNDSDCYRASIEDGKLVYGKHLGGEHTIECENCCEYFNYDDFERVIEK